MKPDHLARLIESLTECLEPRTKILEAYLFGWVWIFCDDARGLS
jgi:hypothetical protein